MTLTYTPRLKLAVPDFLTEPWHSEFAQAMESIDQVIFNALIAQSTSLWLNSTPYVVGDTVISPDSGAVYTCAVAHTSSASPQTFTQELIDHPTFWAVLAPTLATQAEAEAGVENTKYMSPLRTREAISALVAQTTPVAPTAGLLTRSSATLLKFSPYGGNKIKVAGNLYDIPTAGLPGLGNTGVRVGGVNGQNLGANTTYLLFAELVSGSIVGSYYQLGVGGNSHRASLTAGSEGTEVYWNGGAENTDLSLIGIIRTNVISQFTDEAFQRDVRSWYNRGATPMQVALTANSGAITSTTFVEVDTDIRLNWVNFAGESINLDFDAPWVAAGAGQTLVTSFGLDSGTVAQEASSPTIIGTDLLMLPLSVRLTPSEGGHFATPIASVGGGNSLTCVVVSNAKGTRPVHNGLIIPTIGVSGLP